MKHPTSRSNADNLPGENTDEILEEEVTEITNLSYPETSVEKKDSVKNTAQN